MRQARTKKQVKFTKPKSFDALLKKRESEANRRHGIPGPKVSLAINILEERLKKGWTQRQAHEQSGISYNSYLDIEQAQPTANPKADTLIALANTFGCSVADLWRERKLP